MKRPNTKWKRTAIKIGAALVALAIVIGVVGWHKFYRQIPQSFTNAEDAFKYQSIGTEAENGLPYWIWLVLPRVFPEYLPGPGGYTSLGFVWEEGHETPVGISKKTIGFPRVGITCALCHSGTYRKNPREAPTVVSGAPATRLNPLAYQRFLFRCASDDRFTADRLLPEIEYNTKLSAFDKLLYRYVIIPATRKALLRNKEQFSWTDIRPEWGPGRIDPFNPVKFGLLRMNPAGDKSIGNSDMESLWNQAQRAGHALHWDGLNDSLIEVVLTGALGDGATPKSLPVEGLNQLADWLQTLQHPRYPFAIDWPLAEKGKAIFNTKCAECHAFGGKFNGRVIPAKEIGTDGHRLEMWSKEAADTYNDYARDYPWRFTRFQKADGYVAVPLDGIWLRAPYLHNGSVPSLDDLFKPSRPSNTPTDAASQADDSYRPASFYRGYDVYDDVHVGFVSRKDDILEREGRLSEGRLIDDLRQNMDKRFFLYDTLVPGNGNSGHEGDAYGTALDLGSKKALIEYLKAL